MQANMTFKSAVASRPVQAKTTRVAARRTMVVRAEAQTAVLVMTGLCLAAGRFGLAPTVAKQASAGLKLSESKTDMKSGDPAGFTAVDVLALGSMGHILGVGITLGLKALE